MGAELGIRFDEKTEAWMNEHPWTETTVARCIRCGEYYKPNLGHICRVLKNEQPKLLFRNVREFGKWISTDESVPDNDRMVLVTCKTQKGIKNVNRAYYSDGFWHGSGSMSGVIAWMELPEVYEE